MRASILGMAITTLVVSVAAECPEGQYYDGRTCRTATGPTPLRRFFVTPDSCSAGYIPSESSGCEKCPAGTYAPPAAQSCEPCAANSIAPDAGSSQCFPCLDNYKTLGSNRTQCVRECTPVEYRNASALCAPCPRGTANPDRDSTCVICPTGYVAPDAGMYSCTLCPHHTTTLGSDRETCHLQCLPGSVRDAVLAPQTPNRTITKKRHPGDLETEVRQVFWIRGPAGVAKIQLHNVWRNLVRMWGAASVQNAVRLVFSMDSVPLFRQSMHIESPDGISGVLKSSLDMFTNQAFWIPHGDETVFSTGQFSAIGIFEHLKQCADMRNIVCILYPIMRDKARAILAMEIPSTVRVDVIVRVPCYDCSDITVGEYVVLEWSTATDANASMCIPCPVHTVFTPADPSTRAPGLCTSCGPNTVFFPGATPDVTGPSVPGPCNTTGFAVAVLRRDNRTIEAHMTPQKLTVNVSNTSSV